MLQDMKTGPGRTKCGRLVQAPAAALFLCSPAAPASNHDVLCKAPGASFAFIYLPAVIYLLCVILPGMAAWAAVRWARRWHHRALQQKDDEIFQLVDEWTKSLQQEVDERKQAQQALQESQEIIMRQERLAAVGQLTAGLAHEFNNIMTIVQGHACLLMDNPNLDRESSASLAHITDSVERMTRLIRQMLAFSRKQVMQLKPLDVRDTLEHNADVLGRLLGEQVVLNLDIAPALPPIMADPEMFLQILINLAVNARDAMSRGGQFTIRAADATFAAADIPAKSDRKAGRFVRFSVTDTGCGMDAGTLSHLFEPFFTTKEVGKGPGLGLATVHGIISQHQGWIEVASKPGHGATFDVYLPVTDQAPERPAEPSAPPKLRGGRETILLVEDEEALRELVRDILAGHGYCVLEAANGVDALSLWQENREKVDLLLTDIAMPHGISGRDLADRLRKEAPRLPVIFSSGYSHEMIERNGDVHQGETCLSKPYNPAQLVETVRQALDGVRKRETPPSPNIPDSLAQR